MTDPLDRPIPPDAGKRWLRHIQIEAIRGISGRLELALGAPDAKRPTSLLISGDNGSGKSSIVDALQLGLQGEIQTKRGGAAAKAARSLASSDLPSVRIELADGSGIDRVVVGAAEPEALHSDLRLKPPGGLSGYDRTPLVLRRADILRFWATPPEQRQLIFIRHFRAGKGRYLELPTERTVRLDAERVGAKGRRRDAVRNLAQLAAIPAGQIPQPLGTFNRWVDDHFFGGRDSVTNQLRKPGRLSHATREAIREARAAIKDYERANREHQAAKLQEGRADLEETPELVEVLEEATNDVTRAFRAISKYSAIEAIELRIGDASAVELALVARLTNGAEVDPAAVLSEANRDLMAFLIYVGVAKAAARRGQAQVLVLDDVFQSIDSPIRVAAMDWLFEELKGWQFVLTAHDRLWLEQLIALLRRHQISFVAQEIVEWTLEDGPRLRLAAAGDPAASLRRALTEGDAVGIAMDAGRLLENVCDTLSWTLEVSLTRRRDDRYTIGDLWPPVRKVLKRTPLRGTTDEIDRHLHLRNLLGAHYNDWAHGASLAETRRLGASVVELFDAVNCSECQQWMSAAGRGSWQCRCGLIRLTQE